MDFVKETDDKINLDIYKMKYKDLLLITLQL